MSRQGSRGSAGEYQADEQAGVVFVTVLVGPLSLRATCASEAPTLWT